MDISRQAICENTSSSASIYLSFDSNCTMSSAAYRTVEAIGDLSKISVDEVEDSKDSYQNSTLEAANDSKLKTVKKSEVMPLTTAPPLKALPKNIFQEYRAISSTPTKAQLLRSVDILRGSGNDRGMDLGLAFMGIEDNDKSVQFNEENKENAVPEGEGSTLSVLGEITNSLIEKKHLTMSLRENSKNNSLKVIEESDGENCLDEYIAQAKALPTQKPPVVESAVIPVEEPVTEPLAVSASSPITAPTITPPSIIPPSIIPPSTTPSPTPKPTTPPPSSPTLASCLNACPKDTGKESPKALKKSSPKTSSKTSPTASAKTSPTTLTKPSPNKAAFSVEKKDASTSLGKLKSGIPQKNKNRKSLCEPNLQSNRPGRITNNLSRRTSMVLNQKLAKNDISAIPKLLDKMLKISSNSPNKNEHSKDEVKTKLTVNLVTQGDKRPLKYPHRMSTVLKTTLNSPARKLARKSLINMGTLGRRSVQAIGSSSGSKNIRRSIMPGQRKSMMPTSSLTHRALGNESKLRKSDASSTSARAKIMNSSNASVGQAEKLKTKKSPIKKSPSKKSPTKKSKQADKDILFCSVCLQQFRIKSLLEAHMYSHKEDLPPPKIATSSKKTPPPKAAAAAHSGPQNVVNQCKYCDKKFAIVRALNIHLIQNCSKIPPADKKKLRFSELNHVEKAQLPSVFSNSNSNACSTAASVKTLPKSKTFVINKKMTSMDSLDDKEESSAAHKNTGSQMQPPQSSSKLKKKKTAHAGVYRTPSKSVPCHLCKQSFKSILDYTNHSMTKHSTHPSNSAAADHRSDVDGSTLKTMKK